MPCRPVSGCRVQGLGLRAQERERERERERARESERAREIEREGGGRQESHTSPAALIDCVWFRVEG